MRPKDLQIPFVKGEWRTALVERVWFVPLREGREQPYTFPGWDSKEFFGNNQPVHIEYCSGNGAWIAAKAIAHPEINWVALEKKFPRVRKIWSKIHNLQLNNLIVVCGEALDVTARFIPSNTLAHVYVNFPDPWPKKKHAKNRLIQPPFVRELQRILKIQGEMTLVTDDSNYSQQMIDVLQGVEGFTSSYPEQGYTTDWESYGNSYFDSLWREKGRVIRYHHFVKGAREYAAHS